MQKDPKSELLDASMELDSFEEEFFKSKRAETLVIASLSKTVTCPNCGSRMVKGAGGKYYCPQMPHDVEDDNQSFYNNALFASHLEDLGEC